MYVYKICLYKHMYVYMYVCVTRLSKFRPRPNLEVVPVVTVDDDGKQLLRCALVVKQQKKEVAKRFSEFAESEIESETLQSISVSTIKLSKHVRGIALKVKRKGAHKMLQHYEKNNKVSDLIIKQASSSQPYHVLDVTIRSAS